MRMVGMPKNFIGTKPGRVYSWANRMSIQSASGTAVTFPQAAERPLSGLNVYGHSTQSGTPSPENPVPIVSAGDDGEINVSVSDGGTQSQTLTLSTPGGLPGVPDDFGGNYTDESGQQWVCDEIDLKRGKYVKRVKSVTFDGSENWKISSSDEGNQYFNCSSTKPDYTEDDPNMAGLSSMVKVVRYNRIDIYGDNDVISWMFYWRLRLSNLDISAGATVDDLKQFLASNPITVYYTSLTPIETDLPAEEIAAYKALHTYTPNTSVGNDAGTWMKVGYVAEE